MTFLEASKLVLEKNNNKPLSCSEIWKIIEDEKMVDSVGKTPILSLNTILHRSNDFQVTGNPHKFQLKNYMPKNIKETMIQNGFITIDMVKDIFEKNGLKFEL